MVEIETAFKLIKKVFENIIDICIHHNKQSLELDVNFRYNLAKSLLLEKLKNREIYLDIYIKTQLATLKDSTIYFDSQFQFGYKKHIDIDGLTNHCNSILINKFNKFISDGKFKFEDRFYELF
jgi:hypothetical protein